ncbi:MAG: aminotransferase class V-fold PLP-dependent enzyme, partial [Terriglobus sp.]
MNTNRRTFLKSAAACAPAAMIASAHASMDISTDQAAAPIAMKLTPNSIPVADLPRHYDVDTDIHNLENGYWGVMPRAVAQVYAEQSAYVNRHNSIWARNVMPGGACLSAGGREAREAIAKTVGVAHEEVAITRSGSDALQSLICNYKAIKPGDAVIYCDLDYDAMIA